MTHKLIAITLLAATATQMCARERNDGEMIKAAAAILAQDTPSGLARTYATQPLRVLAKASELTVVGRDTGGFAIIANDDIFKAVFAYSDAAYNDGGTNPAFDWYVSELNAALTQAKAEGHNLEKVRPAREYANKVDELLTSRWGQDTPYNLLTPKYTDKTTGNKVNYVTGCVATAMAQILYFHKYPVKGEGDIIYDFAPGGGEPSQTLEADFSDTYYDWANMLDTYTAGAYNDAQAKAVATLMLHCGYSVRMQYTKSGSGAYSREACRALRENFGCKEWTRYLSRDIYNVSEWMQIIFKELNDRCPVLYGGQSSSGGHCFVLDGYDKDGLVHVNWGWNGSQNGFFDIASLNGYNSGQKLVYVRPASDPRYDDRYKSIFGMLENFNCDFDDNILYVNGNEIGNLDIDEFNGCIQLRATNTATGEDVKLKDLERLTSLTYGYSGAVRRNSADMGDLADGTYRVYLASLSDDEEEPQPVRTSEKYSNSYIVNIKGGTITSCEPESDSSWTAIKSVKTNGSADSDVTRVFDTTGRLLLSAPTATFSLDDMPTSGVLIVKNGSKAAKVVKR